MRIKKLIRYAGTIQSAELVNFPLYCHHPRGHGEILEKYTACVARLPQGIHAARAARLFVMAGLCRVDGPGDRLDGRQSRSLCQQL